MIKSFREVSAKKAFELIQQSNILSNIKITEPFNLRDFIKEDECNETLEIENCWFQDFDVSFFTFHQPIIIKYTKFRSASFMASYFNEGLKIENCFFEGNTDFQCSDHIASDVYKIELLQNTFIDFVNFFDCFFDSSVIIKDNNFKTSTNLFGNIQCQPFFKNPIIENNSGKLDDNKG